MASARDTVATIEELFRFEGKAELVDGRIIPIMPTGRRPNLVAGRIYRHLAGFVEDSGLGEVYTDNMGFVVPELGSGRKSFSPDVSFYRGPFSSNVMRFVDGAPTFAVEVRSEGDYRPAAEAQIEAKRADYFEAGTLVVWDVDPIAEEVRIYRRETPAWGDLLVRGGEADAEPAVSGWRIGLDWVFG